MSRHGFRFVHATCLCLDEHLIGTGSLPPEDRELAEDATFRAWDSIVETTLSAQADMLLLTGNSFNSRTNSLRARVALEKGFEKLAAQNVAVFIAAGELDPATSWRRNLKLPPNVTLLGADDQEPVAFLRDKQVLATLCVIASPESDEAQWSQQGPAILQRQESPFRIGIVPAGTPIRWQDGRPVPVEQPGQSAIAATLVQAAIDQRTSYIALGEGQPRTEQLSAGVAHDPGCAQALNGDVTGSRGCSLIEVSPHGEVRIDPIAVAPVRWETISLTAEPHTNWNDLAERMALAVMDRVADNDERLWILTWRLSGSGQVFDALAKSEQQSELWTLVEAELAGETEVRRAHRLERINPLLVSDPELPEVVRVASKGLLRDFEQALDERGADGFEQARRTLSAVEGLDQGDGRNVRHALQQASRQRVFKQARNLAARWLE